MGHRAHLVLRDSTTYHLFYCHWCASTLTRDLFWGPHYAQEFIRNQVELQPHEWLNTAWAEGAVLLDPQHSVLLLSGGESLLVDVPLRRLYLALLQEVWHGWSIRWAHAGLFDIVNYLGLPRWTVAPPEAPELLEDEHLLHAPDDLSWLNVVGSVVFEDGSLRLFPLLRDPFFHLAQGSRIIDVARVRPGLERLNLEYWIDKPPQGGFHCDLRTRQLSFWTATRLVQDVDLAGSWPGWTIVNDLDHFEQQLDKTAGLLTFPTRSLDELIAQLRRHLLGGVTPDNPRHVRHVAERLRTEGSAVQMNPLALHEQPPTLTSSLRESIFAAALMAWNERRNR